MNARQPNSASAHLAIGDGHGQRVPLNRTPVADVTAPGRPRLILGWSNGGAPIILHVCSLEWLDDLEDAIQAIRDRGRLQAELERIIP